MKRNKKQAMIESKHLLYKLIILLFVMYNAVLRGVNWSTVNFTSTLYKAYCTLYTRELNTVHFTLFILQC